MQERKLPRRTVLLLGAALAGWCAGCSVLPAEETASSDEFSTAKAEPVEKMADTGFHLRDNDALYTVYDDSGVVTMYLTVTRGTEAENTDHTWEQINSYSAYDYEAMQVPRYQVEGLLQVGDESGPAASEVGYGETVPNATVQIRGQTSSRNAQKNYKIKLKKNKGSWRGQRTVALNKHQGDGLRFRNKMAYDLIRLKTDPAYDKTAFEQLLEIKGSDDHQKLIEMLDVLNDETSPMEDLFETTFDTENIAYWMAFQILLGNTDTQSRNMYLYSPLNSKRWYILDWDNDAMLSRTEWEWRNYSDSLSWERGVSNYWGNVLFRRCLQTKRFRQELDTAIEELFRYFSPDRIGEMTARCRSLVEPFVWQQPDLLHEPLSREEYDRVAKSLHKEITENREAYRESLKKPMPFYIGVPEPQGDELRLMWDASFDFAAEDITYTAELAKDYRFTTTFWTEENIRLPETVVYALPAGHYFLRVRAANESGYTQDAFDYYVMETGKAYGMKSFFVEADGSDAVIKLERKKKVGSYIYKEDAALTREETERILRGDYGVLLASPQNLCREFYVECVSHVLRPRVLVDYEREAWVLDEGTVRITFDQNVRAAVGGWDLFDPKLPTLPVLDPGTLVLEGFRPYNVPQMAGALLAALAISSNVVISLGMVGALSIVRFRTAVKDPLDLLYLFWSITAGITTGAGMYLLAVAASAVMIGMVVFLSRWQTAGRSYVAVLHYQGEYHG